MAKEDAKNLFWATPACCYLVLFSLGYQIATTNALAVCVHTSRDSGEMRLDDADDVATALGDLPPVSTAFAYGSAVFGQRGCTEADRRAAMTDLVLVVDDPVEWHRANLQLHASHYSFLGGLGVDAVSMAQAIGAGVYYNTGVRLGGRRVKYGVIGEAVLSDDLQNWTSLYIAGRMHKPVRMLQPATPDIERLAHVNLCSAVAAALLILPARFSEGQLLETICGLSYGGDVRMGVGESRHKPDNIAKGQRGMLASSIARLLPFTACRRPPSTVLATPPQAALVAAVARIRTPSCNRRLACVRAWRWWDRFHERASGDAASASWVLRAVGRQFKATVAIPGTHPSWQQQASAGRRDREQPAGRRGRAGYRGALATQWQLGESEPRAWRSSAPICGADCATGESRPNTQGVFTAGAATSLSYALVKMRGARLR